MGLASRSLDIYYTYLFVRLLTIPWTQTPAYRLGIIDKKGKILRKMSSLKTNEEKDAFSYYHNLVWHLRRLLEKTPLIGQLRLTNYVSALWLVTEEFKKRGMDNPQLIEDEFINYLRENYSSFTVTKQLLESTQSTEICIQPGKYKIKDTDLWIGLDEKLFPVGICLNHKIYQVENHVFTSNHISLINEDGEGGGDSTSTTTSNNAPSNTVNAVMPYLQKGLISGPNPEKRKYKHRKKTVISSPVLGMIPMRKINSERCPLK